METTRHFVATVYVVEGGATLLHEHARLGMWLPPGGHVERDELPHEAALREVREETGLDVELVAPVGEFDTGTVRSLPRPQHLLLEDINVHDGAVGHQHVDLVFYGRAADRSLSPGEDERPASAWRWFTPSGLSENESRLEPDVVQIGRRAIETVDGR
jgi:8-oxo-dGTP pyrophosphatase MutT (NUDIX family)